MDWTSYIIAASSIVSACTAITMALFAYKSAKASQKALVLSRESQKNALDIATGNITPKVLCLAQVSGDGIPCITMLNVSQSTVIITSCGICINNDYFAINSPVYQKSCFLSNGTAMQSFCVSRLNCTLEPGNYCYLPLARTESGSSSHNSEETLKKIEDGLANGNCFVYCAFSNHIEKNEKAINRLGTSTAKQLVDFDKCTESDAKTLLYWDKIV